VLKDSVALTQESESEDRSPPQNELHPVLEGVRQLMPGLARSLGPDCELVLHDFADISHSLVAIEGTLTGRTPGSPLTDLILRVIRKHESPPDLINYPSQISDGRILRSSTYFFRDAQGKVIGCLCFNRDISNWTAARNLLTQQCETRPLLDEPEPGGSETFVHDVEELLRGTINEILSQEQTPVKFMEKSDKIRVVLALDARGIFLIRGAVEAVAQALNVSRYTIYNYLDEGRQSEPEGGRAADEGAG
jgi:predicted transcriptional regulator YheO